MRRHRRRSSAAHLLRGGSRPRRRRPLARLAGISALVIAAVGLWGAISMTGDSGTANAGSEDRALIAQGRELNDSNRHRKAARALRTAISSLGEDATQRVRATAYFELGIALRGAGKFQKAKKPLRRSKRMGISAGAVGLQLAKARAQIRN